MATTVATISVSSLVTGVRSAKSGHARQIDAVPLDAHWILALARAERGKQKVRKPSRFQGFAMIAEARFGLRKGPLNLEFLLTY
jgi:hypothetical protein